MLQIDVMKIAFLVRFIPIMLFLLAVDWYAFQSLRTLAAKLAYRQYLSMGYWLITVLVFVWFFYGIMTFKRESSPPQYAPLAAMFILLYVPKLIVVLFLFSEDVFRLLFSSIDLIKNNFSFSQTHLPERRKFFSQLAIAIATIPFAGILYGITKGKYNYTVFKETLFFEDLPEAFDGFTIAQISDIHSGSFDSRHNVERGVNLVNKQGADVVLFTGDIVNNYAHELEPWKEVFAKLKAPMGVFSILGNHDYGDYGEWSSKEEKANNLQRLKTIHQEIGFRLLLNENVILERNGSTIGLVGVENWGLPPFPQHGDLNRALQGLQHSDFKILMSHDPSHWKAKVVDHPFPVHLTLSGHTHGMQFGIELPGFRWSPVKFKYPQWAGLYHEAKQYLYVNRGFGFIGFPGRVGIMPEVTVITLKKV